MGSLRLGWVSCLLFLSVPMWAQQTQTPTNQAPSAPALQSQTAPTLPPATKDAQAISVVNQALTTAGGLQAIAAVTDYTGTGNITFGVGEVQGTVTVRGQGLNRFRMDTTLPSGERSEVTNGATTLKDENGVVTKLHTQPPLGPARLVLPYLQLKAALTSKSLNLLYKGIVEVDGHPTQDVQIQHLLPIGPDGKTHIIDSLNVDFFIDSSTFQVVMMQDTVSKYFVRQIRYSNFTTVSGVLVPFSISENARGQGVWLIQLGQLRFNSGVQDSDFTL